MEYYRKSRINLCTYNQYFTRESRTPNGERVTSSQKSMEKLDKDIHNHDMNLSIIILTKINSKWMRD